MTIQCSMVTLSLLLPGALYFTKHSLTFTADDSSEAFSKAISLVYIYCHHGKFTIILFAQGENCSVSESYNLDSIVAVFSRRYLHKNTALEIFFSNKCNSCNLLLALASILFVCLASMFLTFETTREVKQVVSLLPKVGVGAHYNLPQTRCDCKNSKSTVVRMIGYFLKGYFLGQSGTTVSSL